MMNNEMESGRIQGDVRGNHVITLDVGGIGSLNPFQIPWLLLR